MSCSDNLHDFFISCVYIELFQKKSVSHFPPVEDNGFPGGFEFLKFLGEKRKEDFFLGEKRKNQWKIPRGGESFDGIPRTKVSENGYPQ